MKIYMAVTSDRYELPIFVTDDVQEMAATFGTTKNVVLSSISHRTKGRRYTFIRINIDEVGEQAAGAKENENDK